MASPRVKLDYPGSPITQIGGMRIKSFLILMEDSVLPPPTRQVGRALDWWLIDVPLGSVHIRARFSGIGQMGFGIFAPRLESKHFPFGGMIASQKIHSPNARRRADVDREPARRI